MNLLPPELLARLPPLGTFDEVSAEQVPVAARLHLLDAPAVFYVLEAECRRRATGTDLGDYRFYGLVRLGDGPPELGYFTLAELREVAARYGHAVEHDRRYAGTLAQALRAHGLPVPHSPERPDRADGQGLSL